MSCRSLWQSASRRERLDRTVNGTVDTDPIVAQIETNVAGDGVPVAGECEHTAIWNAIWLLSSGVVYGRSRRQKPTKARPTNSVRTRELPPWVGGRTPNGGTSLLKGREDVDPACSRSPQRRLDRSYGIERVWATDSVGSARQGGIDVDRTDEHRSLSSYVLIEVTPRY